VAAVVAIVSIGEGMQQTVESQLGGLGADIITITPGASRATGFIGGRGFEGFGGGAPSATSKNAKNLTIKDVQALKSIDNVEYVQGTVSGRGEAYYLGERASVSVDGVDPLVWNGMTTSELESGRFLGPSEYSSVVVGSRIAQSTFKQPLALNRLITIEGRSFKIVGILKESGGFGGSDSRVIMPIQAARDTLEDVGTDEFDSITIKVSDAELVDKTMEDIDAKLMITRHVAEKTKDYSISSSKTMQETINTTVQSITLFLGAIAAVSLLVGAVGIANTMFTTVLEKTKEIGIMKAIGAKNRDIMMIFLLNSALVGVVGGVIGIVLGSIASTMMPAGMGISMPGAGRGIGGTLITPELLFYALSIAIGIAMAAGAIPAYRASKLKPVDALRYE
jgi:putative ABC transport system permease protein